MTFIVNCMLYGGEDAVPEPIQQPDSIYVQSPEWKCGRCGKSFSEPYPTRRYGVESCPFDE